MEVRYFPTPEQMKAMNTSDTRKHFLLENLFVAGKICLVYSHIDRMIIGGVVPMDQPIYLEAEKELAADYFAERRELGVFVMAGEGSIRVDGVTYPMKKYDMLYIGRGSRDIEFFSDSANYPAQYYVVSLPAHTSYPTCHIKQMDANPVLAGEAAKANERVIYQYIHNNGVQSCQLVMGFTALKQTNVWNTMPPHLHDRRSEVYMYFDMNDEDVVFHLMGQPQETRHLVMRQGDAVISPSWSIHAGVGTQNYAFVWAMGGENQEFTDMDGISLAELA